jgi:ribonuclease HI
MCFEFDFVIVSDGGAVDPGAGNHGYGSYQLSNRDGRKETIRLDLGTATNNEAEYRALIAALEDLTGRITRAGKSPTDYSLVIQTDSQLVANQVAGQWQVKAANLARLCDRARELLAGFGLAQVEHVPRVEIVRVLGH